MPSLRAAGVRARRRAGPDGRWRESAALAEPASRRRESAAPSWAREPVARARSAGPCLRAGGAGHARLRGPRGKTRRGWAPASPRQEQRPPGPQAGAVWWRRAHAASAVPRRGCKRHGQPRPGPSSPTKQARRASCPSARCPAPSALLLQRLSPHRAPSTRAGPCSTHPSPASWHASRRHRQGDAHRQRCCQAGGHACPARQPGPGPALRDHSAGTLSRHESLCFAAARGAPACRNAMGEEGPLARVRTIACETRPGRAVLVGAGAMGTAVRPARNADARLRSSSSRCVWAQAACCPSHVTGKLARP